MNYLEYYGLQQEPFSNAPVSKFFFNSAQHTKALMRLMYAAESMKGLALLIGDIGAGKTTLARRMLDQLPEDEYEAALLVIIHTGISHEWLLKRIATQLGVANPSDDKTTVIKQLYERLVEIHESGKKAVVLIDEAQMLQTREIMEEFRGLLNLEVPGKKLLTFVFFGLPDLEENLKLDPPLAQRVALRYHLDPLSDEATSNYIDHRLRLAGTTNRLFDTTAVSRVHHYSRGIPRLINTICDNALFEGSMLKRPTIDAEIVDDIARDLGLAEAPSRSAAYDTQQTKQQIRTAQNAARERMGRPSPTSAFSAPSAASPKAAPRSTPPAAPPPAPAPSAPSTPTEEDSAFAALDALGGGSAAAAGSGTLEAEASEEDSAFSALDALGSDAPGGGGFDALPPEEAAGAGQPAQQPKAEEEDDEEIDSILGSLGE